MNDYTVRLMAIERTSAFEREVDHDRLVAEAKRSNDEVVRPVASSARRLGFRGIIRRLSLRPL